MIKTNEMDLQQRMLVLLGRLRAARDAAMMDARKYRALKMPAAMRFAVQQARFNSVQVIDQTRAIRRYVPLLEAR